MQLVIEVPDKDAPQVREFLKEINKPVKPHKGIPGVVVKVVNGSALTDLTIRGIKISVNGMPQVTFAKGDVVENTKSGNWGVVTKVAASGRVTIKTSKNTFAETGEETMSFDASEAALLV